MLSYSTDMSQNMANGVAAGLSALGSVNKSDNSTIYSAIGPTIYLTVDQGEIPTGLSRDTQNANAKTERFSIEQARERQEMAQVIGDIAKNSITIALKPRLDKAQKDKEEAEERLRTHPNDEQAKAQLAQADSVIANYGQGSDIQMAIRAVTGVLQGVAIGSVGQAVVGGLSPYANNLLKEATTDPSTGQVNKTANLMGHALLGAIEAYATGNHVGAGAAGAATGEVAAELITTQLYGQTSPDALTEEQKQTVTALSQLASGLAGGLVGDSTTSAISGAEIGKRAVENNFLTKWDLEQRNKLLDKFEKQAYLSPIEQQVISGLLMKDGRTDELLQRYQTQPERLTEEEKRFLFHTVDVYVASHPGVTRESVLMMDSTAKIDRPTQGVITYLQQQNAWNNRPETRIAMGVYDGLSIVGPGAVGAGIGASTLVGQMIQNAAIGTFANGIVQITSDGKYDFVENVTAGIVSAATTGKGLATTVITNATTSGVTAFVQGENVPSSVLIGGIGASVGHYVKSPVLSSFFDEGTQSLLKNLTPKPSMDTHNYFLEKGTENERIK